MFNLINGNGDGEQNYSLNLKYKNRIIVSLERYFAFFRCVFSRDHLYSPKW